MRGIKLGNAILIALLVFTITVAAAGPERIGPPRTTQHAREVRIQEALQWLTTQQEDDGSFGHSASLTADMVFVLGTVGERPDRAPWVRNGHSALDALRRLAPSLMASGKAGNIAKVLRAVAVTRHDEIHHFAGYDLVRELLKTYDANTGRFDPSNNFAQALALQALTLAGETPPANAVLSLINDQHADGGWGWQYRGTSSDVDTTGLVVATLRTMGIPATLYKFHKTVYYFQAMQQPDGGWGMNTAHPESNCNSTALALTGLVLNLVNPRIAPWTGWNHDGTWRDPVGRLFRFQEQDGGFRWRDDNEGTRLLATRDALIALSVPWPGDGPLSRQHVFPLIAAGW